MECVLAPSAAQTLEGLLEALVDGVILARLINQTKPGAVDEARLRTDLPRSPSADNKSVFALTSNLDLVLQGARAIGCKVRLAPRAGERRRRCERPSLSTDHSLVRTLQCLGGGTCRSKALRRATSSNGRKSWC